MRFWINNVSELTIWRAIGMLVSVPMFCLFFFLVYAFPERPEIIFSIYGVIAMAAFIIDFGYLRNKYFEVLYDGYKITYNYFSGEKTVDVAAIKTVILYLEQEYSRLPQKKNYQVLKIEFYDTHIKPVELYDVLTDENFNLICQGIHAKAPLFLMYDDIVAKSPDKMGGFRGWR